MKTTLSHVAAGAPTRPAERSLAVFSTLLLALIVAVGPAHAQSFNAARAMQYTREVVALGPRPIGSTNHKKLENYIAAHLKSDQVEDDAFVADTPRASFP